MDAKAKAKAKAKARSNLRDNCQSVSQQHLLEGSDVI